MTLEDLDRKMSILPDIGFDIQELKRKSATKVELEALEKFCGKTYVDKIDFRLLEAEVEAVSERQRADAVEKEQELLKLKWEINSLKGRVEDNDDKSCKF